jgi:hypothetical protein
MSFKEVYFIRHTENVTPDSYDFDLSRKGRRQARQIGWYLTQQDILHPVSILCLGVQHAETMTSILSEAVNDASYHFRKVLYMPPAVHEDNREILNILRGLDGLSGVPDMRFVDGRLIMSPPPKNERPPNTAVFIIHKMHAKAFDPVLLLTPAGAEHFRAGGGKEYAKGDCVHIRFSATEWKDIQSETGLLVRYSSVDNIRPGYRASRQEQRNSVL